MSNAIVIDSLVKRYGDLRAVDGLSLTIESGEFFGLLGPNGAGKTTTINCIVGLSTIQGGRVAVCGHDVVTDYRQARRCIGLSPQEFNFDRYLSIREVLVYTAGYFGIPSKVATARADELLKRFDLWSKRDHNFTKLSGGMKRRLSLARALIYEPKVLILDEPTAGVDVELRLELWALMQELNSQGITIVLTTHYLEEAQQLCKRIGIINHGRLVTLESTEALLGKYGEGKNLQDIFLELTGRAHG
ncbi:MAG TPA: ABC transporter ATP-binding protein [Stenomitos sp.]